MTPWPTKHLTADDLDAFHSEALSSEMRLHLETCEECRRLVLLDRQVLDLLAQVPSYGPSNAFADRVMAGVRIGSPAPVPVLSFPRFTKRRIAAMVGLAAGMVASVGWSAANRPLLESWLDGSAAALWDWGTVLWQNGLTYLAAQPWFESLRSASGSPVRLAAVGALTIGLYATGLLTLRRLVTPSAGSVSNAGA